MDQKTQNGAAVSSGDDDQPSTAVFEEIRQEIGKINPYAETIELTYHLRKFAELFRRRITNDQLLSDLFPYLNEAALSCPMFAIKLATVFASRQLADASIYEAKVRNAMIATLQQNFLAIERLKQENVYRFYNSVSLLGEYYHRKRVAFGKRIHILGQSLLLLLTSELEQEISKSCQQQQPPGTYRFEPSLAKLVLAQILLNGEEVKEEHQKEVRDLLYTVRKALIVIPNLCAHAKSFLLMTLDIYYGQLAGLNNLYGKYLNESDGVDLKAEQKSTVSQKEVNGHEVAPKENGVETALQPSPDDTHKPSVTGVKTKDQQAQQSPVPQKQEPAAGQKPKAVKPSTSERAPSGRSGKASSQSNNTTNDKENKRRSQTKPVTPVPKTSPKSTSGSENRSIRLQEDGNIVATITRRDTTATAATVTSPTKRHPPQPLSSTPSRSSTSKQKLSPRMGKLATLPKITVTSATPSPKRTQDRQQPASVSPRAVLGPSIAKQKSHPPPKSPTTRSSDPSREGQAPVGRTRHERNLRDQKALAASKVERQNAYANDALKHTEVEVSQPSRHSPYAPEVPERQSEYHDWSAMPEPEPVRTSTSASREQTNDAYGDTIRSPTPPYYLYEKDDPLDNDLLIEGMVMQQVNPQTTSFLSFLTRE
ncbi:uncharacterized protein LOC118509897 [Anopheles stephensi]|uniref:uncharacterized protein LOC118509897 n=1 Tax=Anopheles stephensi TaxID=30069 RepID=UPI0016587C12|nr:uncharacterized protein LOC118509897 [Anopheles stephensi]